MRSTANQNRRDLEDATITEQLYAEPRHPGIFRDLTCQIHRTAGLYFEGYIEPVAFGKNVDHPPSQPSSDPKPLSNLCKPVFSQLSGYLVFKGQPDQIGR